MSNSTAAIFSPTESLLRLLRSIGAQHQPGTGWWLNARFGGFPPLRPCLGRIAAVQLRRDQHHRTSCLEVMQDLCRRDPVGVKRSEEHTSELQSLMRISYAVFCLKKKTKT